MLIGHGSTALIDYTVSNNTFWGADGANGAIYAAGASGAASSAAGGHLNGAWTGNQLGKTGTTGSGCANNCAGIGILPGNAGTYNTTFTSNDIRQVNSNGIDVINTIGAGATFSASAKFKKNTLTEPDTTGPPLFQRAISIAPGNSGGASTTMCAEIGDNTGGVPADENTINGTWQASNFIRITNANNTLAMTMPGLSPASGATGAQVDTFVEGSNAMAAGTVNSTVGVGINGSASPCP